MVAPAVAVVDIAIKEMQGHIYASSADVPGFHLCGQDRDDIIADIPEAIKLIYKLNQDVDVEVVWAVDPTSFKPVKSSASRRQPVKKLLTYRKSDGLAVAA